MKKIIRFVLMGLIGLVGCKSVYENNEITFSEGDKMSCCIVVPSRTKVKLVFPEGGDYSYAAKLLQGYFKDVTGMSPMIIKDNDTIKDVPVFVGPCSQVERKFAENPKLKPEKPEEYSIFPLENGMAITGEIKDGVDNGTLFGVYNFAERVLGIRWYFPIPEELGRIVPDRSDIKIKRFQEKNAPFYTMRRGFLTVKIPAELKHPYLRTGSSVGPMPNHTQENWKRLYGKTHPEYFGVTKDGKSSLEISRTKGGHQSQSFLCYSNPAVLERMIKNIENFDKTGDTAPWGGKVVAPQGKYILFCPDDTHKTCCCETCAKFKKEHPTPAEDRLGENSEYIFSFVAKYADAIKKRWPDRILRVAAYQNYERPPVGVKLPDNVEVMICLMQSASLNNNDEIYKNQKEILEGWYNLLGKDKKKLMIWDYMCWPNGWIDTPVIYPATLAKWHEVAKDKINGVFCNGLSHTYDGKTPEGKLRTNMTVFMVWFYSRFLWNPDIKRDEMLKEFCDDLFGDASADMQEFFKTLCDCWDNTHQYKCWGTWKSCPEESDLRKIYPPKTVGHLKSLIKNSIEKAPVGSIYRKRLEWFYDGAFKNFLEEYSKENSEKK